MSHGNLIPKMIHGLLQHLLFTLKLNFRSKQAMIYGYVVPIFFLIAFGTLFRGGQPRLLAQMGQLLTISTLGGACFGMPTSMVAERERGVWRRYRLLPAATGGLLISTMLARYLIIASAAVMQIALARFIYGTPLPSHPIHLLIAFTIVAFSFEAMGLVIAAAADNVPAVQALGQAIFLPMIMIGGVGVPLSTLPDWAQKVAGFLPGRYAVEAMQPCFGRSVGFGDTSFPLLALMVIGIAGCLAGVKLFRWDANQRIRFADRAWVLVAIASWIAVGITAAASGHLKPVIAPATQIAGQHPWDAITQDQIDSIRFTGLEPDDGKITPVAPLSTNLPVPEDQQRMDRIRPRLDAWGPGHVADDGQRVRNLLCVAAVADYVQDDLEGPIARAVFDRLEADFDKEELIQILAWIITNPDAGTIINDMPELDVHGPVDPDVVRQRDMLYAKKLLGRLLGKLPDMQSDT